MKPLRIVGIVVAVAALLAVGHWAYRQWRTPPDVRVKWVIDDIRAGIEAGSVGAVMKHISNDYWDGTYTKMDLRRMALQALQSAPQYSLVIEGLKVDPIVPGANQAIVHIRASLSQTGASAETAAWQFKVDGALEHSFWHGWQAISFTGWQLVVDKEMGGE